MVIEHERNGARRRPPRRKRRSGRASRQEVSAVCVCVSAENNHVVAAAAYTCTFRRPAGIAGTGGRGGGAPRRCSGVLGFLFRTARWPATEIQSRFD